MLLFLLIPIAIAVIMFLVCDDITVGEFITHLVVCSLVVVIAYAMAVRALGADTEIWNGRILSKARQQVHCRHDYSCNCVTVSCGKDCTTMICQTCYEHDYDVDWVAMSNVGERFRFPTRDRQGLEEPARWTGVKVNDPVSVAKPYFNYFKLSGYGLFAAHKSTGTYPGRPSVYDYYKYEHLLNTGYTPPNASQLAAGINDINARLGPTKQCNILLAVVTEQSPGYAKRLETAWAGLKKNDVLIVMNVDGSSITWVEAMALTDKVEYFAELKTLLEDKKITDTEYILSSIEKTTQNMFIRKPLRDFSYLDRMITLPTGYKIALAIIAIIISVVVGHFLNSNEIHTTKNRRSRYYY